MKTTIHSFTPNFPSKKTATLPFTAKSKNWKLGNDEAKKYTVAMYEDNAVAILGKNEKLRMAVTTVYLRPNISFKGDNIPDKTIIDEMHHRAHQECFIANSVLTEIIIEPVY